MTSDLNFNPKTDASCQSNATVSKKPKMSCEESSPSKQMNEGDQSRALSEDVSIQDNPQCQDTEENIEIVELEPEQYLPSYLKKLVHHHHGDFFYSPYFEERLIAQLMCEGFLPIATNRYLLPKLHVERSVIYPLAKAIGPTPDQGYTCQVHTPRSTRKKSKRYCLTVNQSFTEVIHGCHDQHGISWLFPPIVQAFESMHRKTKEGTKEGCVANLWDESGEACPVRLYSIEVWNKETNQLAAGELGYGLGRIYTSLTGFSKEDSAGSVQLAALGKLLYNCGYDMWDLGMALDYKSNLGAKGMKRGAFVHIVKQLRLREPDRRLECDEPTCCKELIGKEDRI